MRINIQRHMSELLSSFCETFTELKRSPHTDGAFQERVVVGVPPGIQLYISINAQPQCASHK